jgi:ribosomal protein S18 acetylase RimI-like enzyme
LVPGGDERQARRLADKCTVALRAGDVVRMLTPGGGGWGTPTTASRSDGDEVAELRLVPMDEAAMAAFHERTRAGFLAELVESGMADAEAVARVGADHEEAFPGGRPADGHFLFTLVEGDRSVGYLWLGPAPGEGAGAWWVYDVEVDQSERGRGLGRRLMELAEEELRRRGGVTLGLNVFGPNHRARSLYESLGYEPTSIRMRKRL